MMVTEAHNPTKETTELHQLNEILDKFVYSCSHDLRAPLASIQGLLRLAERTSQFEATNDCMRMIDESVERMDNFLQSLESYVGNARGPVLRNAINFEATINDILHKNKSEITERNISVNLRVRQPVEFLSDDIRVFLILSHVIQNAIFFQDENKSDRFIDVEVIVNNEHAHIEVCDNGTGISKDISKKVYDMFFRASAASKGSGMGLFLTKEALEKLGGHIDFMSSKGAGTNFIIIIPNSKIN